MSKIIPTLLLCLCSISAVAKPVNPICKGPQGVHFSSGDGSKSNPYLICNQEQLGLISQDTTLLSKWFKLGKDLRFSDKVFPVIGSPETPFQGGFDGDGHTLSAITLTNQIRAPFRQIRNAQIENLTIDDIRSQESASFHVAGLVGKAENSIIHHVNIHNIKLTSINYSGGVIGESVSSSVYYVSVDGSLEHRFGTDASGGLIGLANLSDVFACASHVNISTSYTGQGYISGIGTLIGHAQASRIRNVYSDGNIDYSNVLELNVAPGGGLIGTLNNSSLSNAYYAGKFLIPFSADNEIGPVVGVAASSNSSDVFWDTDVSGITESTIGIGKITETMKKKTFWTNQGFDPNIWSIKNNRYPRLFGSEN